LLWSLAVTILLLEDDPTNAALIQRILENDGYTTLAANNAEEALRFADNASQSIDLLLADIMLRGCHGIDVARRIAVIRPGLKTLFMSGYPLESLLDELPRHRLQLTTAQMFFLQKPFTVASLRFKIAEALGCEVACAPVG
jgi:two-component system cell cycle sensor histidine kinase/response regulator CckA